jgi:hypothetical protein
MIKSAQIRAKQSDERRMDYEAMHNQRDHDIPIT